jgi:4-hydroxy-tetrahydrodipicolinate synthase
MSLPRVLHGIVPPVVTPLLARDRLDVPGLERLLTRIIKAGCAGIFVLGSTGEAQALGYRLRIEMVRETCRIAAGRVPVLAGVTDTAVEETIRLGEQSLHAGASGLVLAPPYYFRMQQSDLLRHVETVANELSAPLFLYNLPGLTKLEFAPETVARAAEIPGVAGIKDSSGDLIYLQRILRVIGNKPDFSVMIGPEELLAQAILLGAHGGVCGGANLCPELYVALYLAATQNRIGDVRSLERKVIDLSENLYRVGDPSTSYFRGIKCALEVAGICSGLPAPPLSRFTDAETAQIGGWLSNSDLVKFA